MYIVLERTNEKLTGVLCHYGPFQSYLHAMSFSISQKKRYKDLTYKIEPLISKEEA